MLDKLLWAAVGYLACKGTNLLGGFLDSIFGGPAGAAPHPVAHRQAAAATSLDLPAGTVLTATSTAVPFGASQNPTGIAFPSGWRAKIPPSPSDVARAQVLLGTLPLGFTQYEKGASGWLAYHKGPIAPGVIGVSVWVPRAPVAAIPTGYRAVSTAAPMPAPGGAMPTLRRGSRGPAVAQWQAAIGIPADGAFGPITDRATRAWQASHGLTPDGIVGPLTWSTVAPHGGLVAT